MRLASRSDGFNMSSKGASGEIKQIIGCVIAILLWHVCANQACYICLLMGINTPAGLVLHDASQLCTLGTEHFTYHSNHLFTLLSRAPPVFPHALPTTRRYQTQFRAVFLPKKMLSWKETVCWVYLFHNNIEI